MSVVVVAGLATGCNVQKETEESKNVNNNIDQEIIQIQNIEESDTEKAEAKELEESGKVLETKKEESAENLSGESKQKDKDDDFYGEYDDTKLSFVMKFKPAWHVLQNVDNKYLTLMEPVKGDAYCIVINEEGEVINEGITDSMYGDSYITEYEGKLAIVNIYDMDEESQKYHVEVRDMEGNVIADLEETYVYDEEEEWYDIDVEKYPYLEGESRIGVTENEKVLLEQEQDGVRIMSVSGQQLGYFKNAYPDYKPRREDKSNALYGELIGDFLFVYQIKPVEGAEYDEDIVWIYKIM